MSNKLAGKKDVGLSNSYNMDSSVRKNAHNREYESFCDRFLKGMRGFWATKHTEDTVDDRELYIKTTLRELLIYLTFLVILSIISLGMISGLTFYHTNILNNLFTTTQFDDKSGSYSTASSVDDYWKFLSGPLLSGLYSNKWYNDWPISNSEINFIYLENKLIGVPRIRQVRVRNDSCGIVDDYKNDIKLCYASYSTSTESTDSFGLANSTAWNYTSEKNLTGRSAKGQISTYGGGGYYVDLNKTQADSLETIKFLFNTLWIDRGTRAVIVDFTVYNANINLFCVIKLIAEFPATGGMIPNSEFRTVKLLRYVAPVDYLVLACELTFIVFTLYYFVEEAIEIKKHKLAYFLSFWNLLDIAVIVLSVVCTALNLHRTISVQSNIQNLLTNDNKYPNFDTLSALQLTVNYLIALTLFFAWIKIFKYISFNKTMTQLSSTLGRCSKDLTGFAVMFIIIFLAFVQLGYLLFGTQCVEFRAFDRTIYSLLRIILGDFNFDQLEQSNRILGPIYFIIYVFFVFLVLFNMFLAIINDTYSEVKSDLANQANEFEVADYIKQQANSLLTKLHFKRDKIIDIQNAMGMADANNDNVLDFDEWKTELKRRGYGEGEIEAVFARYDSNGDRLLDESERRNMQIELENQKAELNKEINMKEVDSNLGNSMNETRVPTPGFSKQEINLLNFKVDNMENKAKVMVTKIDVVLKDLGNVEDERPKHRETMRLIQNAMRSYDNLDEDVRRQKLTDLVREEINKMTQEFVSTNLARSRQHSDFEDDY